MNWGLDQEYLIMYCNKLYLIFFNNTVACNPIADFSVQLTM
jgi:hypothetical protein